MLNILMNISLLNVTIEGVKNENCVPLLEALYG